MCPIAVNTLRAPLFTLETDDEAVHITPYGIEVRVAKDNFDLVGRAIAILPDILAREERRKAYETNHVEAARATLMQALTFGSDEDREHAEDAVQDLVAFIGRETGADCERNTSDSCTCGPKDSCSNCPPDPIAEAITAHWGYRCTAKMDGCACCDAWAAYDALLDPAVDTGSAQTLTVEDIRKTVEWANEENGRKLDAARAVSCHSTSHCLPSPLIEQIHREGFAHVVISALHSGGFQFMSK